MQIKNNNKYINILSVLLLGILIFFSITNLIVGYNEYLDKGNVYYEYDGCSPGFSGHTVKSINSVIWYLVAQTLVWILFVGIHVVRFLTSKRARAKNLTPLFSWRFVLVTFVMVIAILILGAGLFLAGGLHLC